MYDYDHDDHDLDGYGYYYDSRNARPRDRTHGGRTNLPVRAPARPLARPPRSYPVGPARPYRPAPVPVVVAPAPVERGGILGNLTTGEILEIAAQALSAITPLPGAPSPTGTAVDVENLITYQQALAAHAKRVEQVRTLGSVLAKLID